MRYKFKRIDVPFYSIWNSMMARTSNPKTFAYERYGGRGIKVCERWKEYPNFMADMHASYLEHRKNNPGKKMTTLERIDGDGNYEPNNCRWATPAEQVRNSSKTILFKGECALDASIRLGGEKTLVFARIKKMGWPIEKAFTTPPNNKHLLSELDKMSK